MEGHHAYPFPPCPRLRPHDMAGRAGASCRFRARQVMNAMDTAHGSDAGVAGSGHGERGGPALLRRKSVLMGMAASMGVVFVNAAQPSAVAAGTVKPIAATQPAYALKWTPSTAYLRGQQVISPNDDVTAAIIAHTSCATFATDAQKWALSSTFGRPPWLHPRSST